MEWPMHRAKLRGLRQWKDAVLLFVGMYARGAELLPDVLEDALPVSGVAQAWAPGPLRSLRRVPIANGETGAATKPRQLPGQLPLRRLFVLGIMLQLAAHLRQQRGPEAAVQLPTGAPDFILQVLAFPFSLDACSE
ncbi:hypothetical protein COCSUDRAFT_56480 [Coccomyxa subellipsoidea C-169]|uniref:Uncharacterized protein n=1 Tax=Coccomyxa subellipsoidea (strain C-169) TaxID=574566 RepID=I0YUH9_COCSC|nr:hypothetical protein COCSUDRAFT_56480 [Coccomyxa subellipsoidea C-169]EIE22048.1 hypothetical protein COCSUDRAFT_56480 [Coccomyxa subellipsoidea C-169]|eukprot:XP_005646592.1 hypothetical protein COCSUDRAFT_56480 [Coccomyxa subellipsoidea C-169]